MGTDVALSFQESQGCSYVWCARPFALAAPPSAPFVHATAARRAMRARSLRRRPAKPQPQQPAAPAGAWPRHAKPRAAPYAAGSDCSRPQTWHGASRQKPPRYPCLRAAPCQHLRRRKLTFFVCAARSWGGL